MVDRYNIIASRFAAWPAPIRGAAWMVIAAILLGGGMNLMIRYLTAELHPFQVVFFRVVGASLCMLPWIIHVGPSGLSSKHHWLYVSRSGFGLLSMLTWFSALALMPLAEATALGFTAPLFSTITAVLVLHEVVRLRRWSATICGFIGAMIVIRPGFAEVTFPQILVIASAAFSGINAVLVKQLTRTESDNAIVTYMTLYMVPFSLVPALFVWKMPSLDAIIWVSIMAIVSVGGHQAVTRAYRALDASAVAPLEFIRLPVTALAAWLVFSEIPDIWTWIGAAVIVGSTAYIAHRESVLARARAAQEAKDIEAQARAQAKKLDNRAADD